MIRLYIVKWNKQGGKFQQGQSFHSRNAAILYLNHLILDRGIVDAKLVMVKI
jgi:hypothetical protein